MNGSNPFEELLKDTFAGSMDEHTHTHTHTQHIVYTYLQGRNQHTR